MKRFRFTAGVAGLAAALMVATGCAGGTGDGGDASPQGEGLPAGATKEEYIAAFEDVEPIHLIAQTTGPKGLEVFSGSKDELWLAMIEEWSGGKITFDISYSYAIAPVNEVDDALVDGRLDVAGFVPSIKPSEYPVYSEFLKGAVLLHDADPIIGPLHGNAYMLDLGYQLPEVREEIEGHGIHVVFPANVTVPTGVFCNSPVLDLDAMEGAVVATTNATIAGYVTALGGSPTSMPYTEAFEGLQRGAIDCSATAVSIAGSVGTAEAAPNAGVAGSTASLGASPGAYGVNKEKWDSMPLIAQQLFHDAGVAFYTNWTGGQVDEAGRAVAANQEAGGGIAAFDDDINDILKAENDKTLDSVRESDILEDGPATAELMQELSDKWYSIITDELGYPSDVTFDELPAWLEENGPTLDVSDYMDRLYEEVLAKHRP